MAAAMATVWGGVKGPESDLLCKMGKPAGVASWEPLQDTCLLR